MWWMQRGWIESKCSCGATIWPEGDPDWGACFSCFSAQLDERRQYEEEMRRQYESEMRALDESESAE